MKATEKLLQACQAHDLFAAHEAILQGANLNARGNTFYSPLHLALLCNAFDIADMLIEAGACIKEPPESNSYSYLRHAIGKTAFHTAILMIEKGADMEQTDSLKQTPFFLAVQAGAYDVVDALLAKKVALGGQDYKGQTPVSILLKKQHDKKNIDHKMLLKVLDAGYDPDTKNADGRTPLMLAAEHGDAATVKIILQYHPNLDLKDNKGHSAYYRALFNKSPLDAELILDILNDEPDRRQKELFDKIEKDVHKGLKQPLRTPKRIKFK